MRQMRTEKVDIGKVGEDEMKCNNCPLFTWWNNEYDKGESCGIFGDGWDNPLQYEDKDGNTIGCYVDRNYIKKVDGEYMKHIAQEAEGYEEFWKEEQVILGE